MHGAAFSCFGAGQGRAEEIFLGWGGAGRKSSGWGGVTVKLGTFSGWGSLDNFREEAAIFPGAGAGLVSYPTR